SPLFFQCYRYHPDLHSFPTRRSSDLYSPLKTGAGFLPMSVMIVLTATTVQTRVLPRTGAKPLVVSGMGLGVTAMVLLSHVTSHRSEEHTSELQSRSDLVCRLLLEKKK